VRERGQTVMPFDLDRTTHVFRTTASGGVEQVLADDPADRESIRLVREHLRSEEAKFRRGDYQDPMAIHGMAMPGIDELRRGAAAIDVDYRPLPTGAQLRFTTTEPHLRTALHRWFDAQLSDHGADANGQWQLTGWSRCSPQHRRPRHPKYKLRSPSPSAPAHAPPLLHRRLTRGTDVRECLRDPHDRFLSLPVVKAGL
jgi:hypothetical protein